MYRNWMKFEEKFPKKNQQNWHEVLRKKIEGPKTHAIIIKLIETNKWSEKLWKYINKNCNYNVK